MINLIINTFFFFLIQDEVGIIVLRIIKIEYALNYRSYLIHTIIA